VRVPEELCMLVPGPLWGVTSAPILSRSGYLARATSAPRYIEQSGPLDLHAYW